MDIEYGQGVRVAEIKASDTGLEVSGYVSTYGNVDHGGDVVMRGAFDHTIDSKGLVRFLFAHDSHSVLGKPLELRSDDKGLYGRFHISQTQLGKDVHTLLKDGALDSFSIGYIPTDVEFDDSGARLLKAVDLLECSVVAMPMNEQARVTAVKAGEIDDKAVWNTAYVNGLPDSAFAAVYTDGDGNKQRKLPHHAKGGALDMPHLRNALSREPQADMPASAHARARAHLARHAKAEGIGSKDAFDLDEDVPFEDLLGQVGDHIVIATEAAEALQARRATDGRKLAASHLDAIQELLDHAEAATQTLERVLHPPSEVSDGMKLRLELARRLNGHRAVETA